MTDKPIAVRIARPYATEDELLAAELETIGKTTVLLVGAHARPAGVIVRFEVTLSGGTTALRGEGRVLSHKENAFRGQAGLALRFTRLDPRSKALVDRAVALREAHLSGEPPPVSQQEPPPVSQQEPPVSQQEPPPVRHEPRREHEEEEEPVLVPVAFPGASPAPSAAPAPPPTPVSADREAALARLRERGAQLTPERVSELLASAKRR